MSKSQEKYFSGFRASKQTHSAIEVTYKRGIPELLQKMERMREKYASNESIFREINGSMTFSLTVLKELNITIFLPYLVHVSCRNSYLLVSSLVKEMLKVQICKNI